MEAVFSPKTGFSDKIERTRCNRDAGSYVRRVRFRKGRAGVFNRELFVNVRTDQECKSPGQRGPDVARRSTTRVLNAAGTEDRTLRSLRGTGWDQQYQCCSGAQREMGNGWPSTTDGLPEPSISKARTIMCETGSGYISATTETYRMPRQH